MDLYLNKILFFLIVVLTLGCQHKNTQSYADRQITSGDNKELASDNSPHEFKNENDVNLSAGVLIEKPSISNSTVSAQRSPAYSTFVQDSTNRHIKLYKEIMQSKNDSERLNKFKDLIERQISIYYFISNKQKVFDQFLEQLYQKHLSTGSIDTSDKERLQLYHIENTALWEFKEKNLDDLLKLYNLVLVNIHDDQSEYVRESKWIMAKIPFWLRKFWGTDGDQLPIIEIAEKLHQVNTDFKRKSPKVNSNYFPELNTFLKLTQEQSLEATKKTEDNLNNRYAVGSKVMDKTEAQWSDFFSKLREQNYSQSLSDEKYQISGNSFSKGSWSITFTGGPDSAVSSQIYELIKSTHTPTTFFWSGQNIQKNLASVKNLKSPEITHALTSYSNMTFIDLDYFQASKEVTRSYDIFVRASGENPAYFRCPYSNCGSIDSEVYKIINHKNMKNMSWNIDSFDWHDKNSDLIFERMRKQIEIVNSGIIAFNESYNQTPAVAKRIIQFVKSKFSIQPLYQNINNPKD